MRFKDDEDQQSFDIDECPVCGGPCEKEGPGGLDYQFICTNCGWSEADGIPVAADEESEGSGE